MDITLDDLITINKKITDKTGEPHRIVNQDNLESALGVQYSYYETEEQVAAALLRSLVIGHGFANANKRTALAAAYLIKKPVCSDEDLNDLIYAIASEGGSHMSVDDIANVLYGTKPEEKLTLSEGTDQVENYRVLSDVYNAVCKYLPKDPSPLYSIDICEAVDRDSGVAEDGYCGFVEVTYDMREVSGAKLREIATYLSKKLDQDESLDEYPIFIDELSEPRDGNGICWLEVWVKDPDYHSEIIEKLTLKEDNNTIDKLQVLDLIDKVNTYQKDDGNCGMFALALQKFLGDGSVGIISGNDGGSPYHVVFKLNGNIYDGSGLISEDDIYNLSYDQYGDDDPKITWLNNNDKAYKIIERSTDWNIDRDEFVSLLSGKKAQRKSSVNNSVYNKLIDAAEEARINSEFDINDVCDELNDYIVAQYREGNLSKGRFNSINTLINSYRNLKLNEKIVKKGSKWQVQSEKGRNMGTYDTKEEAKKRLGQVEYFKHKNEELILKETTVEKHDELNPDLWDENKELRPEVREKIKEVVKKFDDNLKENEVELKVKDIVIIGSSANYNYNNSSDIDVHIVADLSPYANDPDLAMKCYQAYKSLFNNKYDPMIKGHEVEIYVEPEAIHANSNGQYSFKDGWIKKPVKDAIPDIDIEDDFKPFKERFEEIKADPSVEKIDALIDDIYLLRQDSILKDGEYGKGNLVFKKFRSDGYLDELKDIKTELENKEMSLESLKLKEDVGEKIGLKFKYQIDIDELIDKFGLLENASDSDATYILTDGRVMDTKEGDKSQHENVAKYITTKYGIDDLDENNGSKYMNYINAIRFTPWINAFYLPPHRISDEQRVALQDALIKLNISEDNPLMISNLSGSEFATATEKDLDLIDDYIDRYYSYGILG